MGGYVFQTNSGLQVKVLKTFQSISSTFGSGGVTLLMRNRAPLGSYSRDMPGTLQ